MAPMGSALLIEPSTGFALQGEVGDNMFRAPPDAQMMHHGPASSPETPPKTEMKSL